MRRSRPWCRAGLPLGRGLLDAGNDVRGRLGRIAGILGRRVNRGEGLVEALEAERGSIPTLYRAVVEAGARAGRLPAALEGMANYMLGVADARRTIGLAMWYPGLVLTLAYVLFLGLVGLVVPRFIDAYVSLGLTVPRPLVWLGDLGAAEVYWWPVGPVLIALLLFAWFRSGTTAGLARGVVGRLEAVPLDGAAAGRLRGRELRRVAGACWSSTGCRIPRRCCWPPRRPEHPG